MTVNGVALLRRGAVVGWNWWFLGGYPTSTDIAQNFGLLAFLPMTILGNTLGYHVLHAALFVAVPVFVWWDLGGEEPETRILATAFACFFGAGYLYTITSSGDTNSMVGVFSAGLALAGSHAARRGRRWGGPLMLAALTVALGSHAAFAVYAGLYLLLESIYFGDRAALVRLALASGFAAIAALPVHWESLRYPEFVSFNNTVYQHGEPIRWAQFARNAVLQRRDPGLAAAMVQRLPEPGERLAAPDAPGRGERPSDAHRLLRRLRGPDTGPPPAQHAGGRRDVRSHSAHAAAARGASDGRPRAASRRTAFGGDRNRRGVVALRGDVIRARASRARPSRVRSTAHRPHRRERWQPRARRSQPASRHGQRSGAADAADALRRALRGPAARPGRPAVLQPDDRRVGLEHLPRPGRGRGHVRRAAHRPDAAGRVRR